jgi:hypothetical protein
LRAVTIPVEAVPTVSIHLFRVKGSEDGDSISGRFQVVAVVSLDVVRADFYMDQALKETQYAQGKPSGFLSFWFTFNTADYATGQHALSVKVYDASGGAGTDQITVLFVPPAEIQAEKPQTSVMMFLVAILVFAVAVGGYIGFWERKVLRPLVPLCPKCGREVTEDAYFCPACGQCLVLMEKEVWDVSRDELTAKVQELRNQADVKRIVVMDDLGNVTMEVLVGQTRTRTSQLKIQLPRFSSPRRYTIIVERALSIKCPGTG